MSVKSTIQQNRKRSKCTVDPLTRQAIKALRAWLRQHDLDEWGVSLDDCTPHRQIILHSDGRLETMFDDLHAPALLSLEKFIKRNYNYPELTRKQSTRQEAAA